MTTNRDNEPEPVMVAVGLVVLLASGVAVIYTITRFACWLAPQAHLF